MHYSSIATCGIRTITGSPRSGAGDEPSLAAYRPFSRWQINGFFTHGRSFSLRRTGDARYELTTLTASEEIVIEMWTTKRFGLEVGERSGRPEWLRVVSDADGVLTVEADECDVHFEMLERSAYLLHTSRTLADEWRVIVRAPT